MRLIHALPAAALALSACASMPMMGHHAAAPAPAAQVMLGTRAPAAAPAPAPAVAAAAPAPAAAPPRIGGIVSAINGSTITATAQDGSTNTFTVAPDAMVVKTRPIQASEIKPGDFVATTNVNNADGTGTSTELRVFPAGSHLGEGSYPMAAPNTTMTNATVAQVTNVGSGRQLTVTYGANEQQHSAAGTRTITLPASVQVIQWYRAPLSDVHVGERVRGRAHADPSGAVVADFVLADTPPPPAPPVAH